MGKLPKRLMNKTRAVLRINKALSPGPKSLKRKWYLEAQAEAEDEEDVSTDEEGANVYCCIFVAFFFHI